MVHQAVRLIRGFDKLLIHVARNFEAIFSTPQWIALLLHVWIIIYLVFCYGENYYMPADCRKSYWS